MSYVPPSDTNSYDPSDPPPPAPPAVPPAVPKTNPFARMLGAILSPVETFRSIAAWPDWIVPFTLILLFTVVSTVVLTPHLDLETAMRKQFAKKDMPAAQADRTIEMAKKFQKFNFVIAVIGVGLSLTIIAAVILFTLRAFGGEGTFKQAMAVVSYASIPGLIKGVAIIALVLSAGTVLPDDLKTIVKSNPGAFLSDDASPALVSVLTSFDVFTIWTIALMIIGFAYASRRSRGTAGGVIIGWWVLAILCGAAFSALTGR